MTLTKSGYKGWLSLRLNLVLLLWLVLLLTACEDSGQATTPPSTTAVSTSVSANSTMPPPQVGPTLAQSQTAITNPVSSTNTSNKGNTPALQPIADFPLSGDASRLDYQSLDPGTGLLFIAHLGTSQLIVFDVNQNKVVTTISGVASVHGVLVIPELGRVYASATGDKQVVVIDEKTFQIIAKVPAGNYPDGLAYDPTDHALYVSDEGGTSESVIDTQTNKPLTTIELGGEAGNTQYDPVSGHILVDVQTLNQLTVIDPKTNKILARYPLPECQNSHSLLVAASQRLAFITCNGNARLLVMDLQTMQVIYKDSVGANPDVLALDESRSLLYVASESGTVSIFDESKPMAIHKVWEGLVAKEAHTIAVNNQTHQLYVPLEDVGGKPVLRLMQYH